MVTFLIVPNTGMTISDEVSVLFWWLLKSQKLLDIKEFK